MTYSIWELILFFFIYSALYWVVLTVSVSVYRGRFANVGSLAGPMFPSGGAAVTICAWLIRDNVANYLAQFFLCTVVCILVRGAALHIKENRSGIAMESFAEQLMAPLGKFRQLGIILLCGLGCFAAIALVHPVVLLVLSILPAVVRKVLAILMLIIFAADVTASGLAFRRFRSRRGESSLEKAVTEGLENVKESWIDSLEHRFRKRLYNAYPEMASTANLNSFGHTAKERVFAQGYGPVKMFWVFLICALAGDLTETVYCRIVGGSWMSRSSFLYGPFSVVWGLGAALGVAALSPIAKKNDRWVFFGGFFLGGAYEYLCSVFTELVFGQVFWDYSDYPLNFGGRTNVLFMCFWGMAAVVLMKFIYPKLNAVIEKVPPFPGFVATWLCVILIAMDVLVTGFALVRYNVRKTYPGENSQFEVYLDTQFPDDFIVQRWPNMKSAAKTGESTQNGAE